MISLRRCLGGWAVIPFFLLLGVFCEWGIRDGNLSLQFLIPNSSFLILKRMVFVDAENSR